jgi:hypothetical protein
LCRLVPFRLESVHFLQAACRRQQSIPQIDAESSARWGLDLEHPQLGLARQRFQRTWGEGRCQEHFGEGIGHRFRHLNADLAVGSHHAAEGRHRIGIERLAIGLGYVDPEGDPARVGMLD